MASSYGKRRSAAGHGALAALAAAWLCAPAAVPAQTVLDFGPAGGWRLDPASSAFSYDDAVVHRTPRSLRIHHEAEAAADYDRPAYELAAAAVTGDRLRVDTFIKTAIEDDGVASLWIRVEGADGLLYIDRARDLGAHGTTDWQPYTIEAPLDPAATRISFGAEFHGRGTVWLDAFTLRMQRAEDLPAPSARVEGYVDAALRIIEAHSLRRGKIDWPAFQNAVKTQARGRDSLRTAHLAVRFALSRLGDSHSYFMTPEQMSRLPLRPVVNARTGREAVAPRAAQLEETIGYLALPGFAGGTQRDQAEFAETVQASLSALEQAGVCRWIVDLRSNRGGNLWPMLAGVGPLLGDGEATTAVYPDGERIPLWYRDGKVGLGDYVQLRIRSEPYRPKAGTSPVAVLTGPATASAAEIIAAAFRGTDTARSFGGATGGASTGTRTYTLSDGAAIVLAVTATRDRRGETYVGPIEPDQHVNPDTSSAELDAQPAIRAAIAWLESTPCPN